MKPVTSPSILSANFAYLTNDIEVINGSEAGWVHIDTMDGVFVPNISFGFPAPKYVAKLVERSLDARLMIVRPEKLIPEVKVLGARMMDVYYEACPHLHRVVQQVREAGTLPTVIIDPATPVVMLRDTINDVYTMLVMSVNPGFGGQKPIEYTIDKVRELRELITVTGSGALIKADGGANSETGARLIAAGADVLVTGNVTFSAPDPVEVIHALRNL